MGERFQYHGKSKERLIYHSRLIKDFHAIVNLVVARTSYTKVIHLIVAITTIAIGDKARTWTPWARGKLQEHCLLARTNTIVIRSPLQGLVKQVNNNVYTIDLETKECSCKRF